MELTFRFLLTPAETVRASRAITKGSRSELYWAFFTAALTFCTLVSAMMFWSQLSIPARLLLVAPLGLFLLLAPSVLRLRLKRAYVRDPLIFSEQVFTLSAASIALESAAGQTITRWEAIRETREQPEFYLFFYTRDCAYFLPKRAIPSDQHGEVHEMIRLYARSHTLAREASAASPAT